MTGGAGRPSQGRPTGSGIPHRGGSIAAGSGLAHRRRPENVRDRSVDNRLVARFLAAAHNGRVMTLSLSRALHPDWSALLRRLRALRKRGNRAWGKLSAAPPAVRIVAIAAAVLALLFAGNLVYQVARKPTEMLFLAAGAKKAPAETWRRYAPLFREYSTAAITPELLAGLAQVEGAGDQSVLLHRHLGWPRVSS